MDVIEVDRYDTEPGKTFGSVRELGSQTILKSSLSGWRPGAMGYYNLLDGESWTQAVLEFCRLVNHELPRGGI